MALTPETVVGVVGAGAMGTGIAQVALVRGHRVVLADAAQGAVARAHSMLEQALRREEAKGRLAAGQTDDALGRLTGVEPGEGLQAFDACGLVIEAIVERLDVKQVTFRALEHVVADDAVLATNTSSLSIASIAAACARPERVLGIHFFNPAPVLPLVEIIGGVRSDPAVVCEARELVNAWGKTTVLAADTPGFIVNRIARPFYGEALRVLDEGIADVATIDWAMRELGGFRMGPFELMDFIGHDVNYVVTESVWSAMYFDPRYTPSLTQKRLLEAGLLGRKSGRGFYDHAPGAAPVEPTRDEALGRPVVHRVVCMLINEAVDAVFRRVASATDIEMAMTKGVNYPKGLLAWGESLGWSTVLDEIRRLQSESGEDRYRPSPLLVRLAREGGRLIP